MPRLMASSKTALAADISWIAKPTDLNRVISSAEASSGNPAEDHIPEISRYPFPGPVPARGRQDEVAGLGLAGFREIAHHPAPLNGEGIEFPHLRGMGADAVDVCPRLEP